VSDRRSCDRGIRRPDSTVHHFFKKDSPILRRPDVPPASNPPTHPIRGVRIPFLRKFAAFFLLSVIFAFAAIEGGGFDQPDWEFLDAADVKALVGREPVKWLRDYIRLDTSNPPGNEGLGTHYLAGLLKQQGIASEEICPEPGRCSLVARIEGRQADGGLILLHHIDVIPVAGQEWVVPPFDGAYKDGYLHGRGSIDDKSMGIAFLEAFLDVHRSGVRPERSLIFIADADEENLAQSLGVRWLLAHRPDLFRGARYAFNEGGVNETADGKIQYFGLEVGQPSLQEFELESPDRTAIDAMILGLETRTRPWHVTPTAREFFRRIAFTKKAAWRERIGDLEQALDDPRYLSEFPFAYQALLRPTILRGAHESAPGGAFHERLTLVIPADLDPVPEIAEVRRMVSLDRRIRIASSSEQSLSPTSPFDSPLTRILAEEVRNNLSSVPVGPYLVPFTSTTSKYLRNSGVVTYGISPFRLTIEDAGRIHGRNERIRLAWYLDGVGLLSKIVDRFVRLPLRADETFPKRSN